MAQGGLISPVLFSLYVNDMPSPLHHVEFALHADDTTIIATSRKLTLLVSYLEFYLNDLQRWLSEWRIAINVSKSSAIIFARAGRRFIQPRPVTLFGEPIEWVDATRYLKATLDRRINSFPHIDQVRMKTARKIGMLSPLLNRKNFLFVRIGTLLYKQLFSLRMDHACPAGGPLPAPTSGCYRCYYPRIFAFLLMPHWYVINRQIHEDLGVPLFSRPHQSPDCEL